MCETKSAEVKMEKIKAIRPQIIVTGTVDKPYYEILYYDTSDNVWHIGYSSYILANVIKWKEECFEVVGELEDMQPTADVVEVKHGEWLVNEFSYSKFITCSVCNSVIDSSYTNIDENEFDYCPYCGAKMDGEDIDVSTK